MLSSGATKIVTDRPKRCSSDCLILPLGERVISKRNCLMGRYTSP